MKKIIGLVLLCLVLSISNAFAENEEEFLKRLGLVSFMVAQVSFCQGNLTEEQDEAVKKWLEKAFKDRKFNDKHRQRMREQVDLAKLLAEEETNDKDCENFAKVLMLLLEDLPTK